jgi:hypothetical protein
MRRNRSTVAVMIRQSSTALHAINQDYTTVNELRPWAGLVLSGSEEGQTPPRITKIRKFSPLLDMHPPQRLAQEQ